MKNNFVFDILENEHWWCGVIDLSFQMPYDINSKVKFDMINEPTCNQLNPVFISDKGRWAYLDELGTFEFNDGKLTLCSDGEILHGEEKSLKDAQLYVCKNFFPPDGKTPDLITITSPQYCTWMELLYGQNQEEVIKYAKRLIKDGMPAGEFIIDDGWEEYYGHWDFNLRRFPNPKKMCKTLKKLGFKVVLWIVPYVSPDSDVYRELLSKGLLVKNADGTPYLASWWDGYSAMLDFTNPETTKWFNEQYEYLRDTYGIEGLKMDGGDARFDPQGLSGFNPVPSYVHSELWGAYGDNYGMIKELRACVKNGGKSIIQRISDRRHSWDRLTGLNGLIDRMILQGMSGYFYSCPDMVGGGLIEDVYENTVMHDELYIRFIEASAMMPMWQYSKMFWKGSEKMTRVVKKMTALHTMIAPYLSELAINASKTGEPIMRSICYQFNERPDIIDEFMIGDKYLVAPILTENTDKRTVYLPTGRWQFALTGEIFEGACEIEVKAGLEDLPYFVKA